MCYIIIEMDSLEKYNTLFFFKFFMLFMVHFVFGDGIEYTFYKHIFYQKAHEV